MKTKFPSELPRTQRPIDDLFRFKANELKNIIFYQGILLCVDLMEDREYIDHFLSYLTAIRLLNKIKIFKKDLEDAFCLIQFFVKKYENLYGVENLTYNLHVHLHLPQQVSNHGALFYTSSFVI